MENAQRRRALDQPIRPTRAEVDLAALRHNFQAVKAFADKTEVLCVVKANAYGHGAVLVSRALEAAGASQLGVALVEEGIELRNAGVKVPLLVLGGSYEGGYDLLVEHDLTPTVFQLDHLEKLAAAATRANRTVKAHVKVDTGMGRIGVLPPDLAAFAKATKRYGNVEIEGLISHFANADLADAELTKAQVRIFKEALATFEREGIHPKYRHLSNSAGVLDLPEVRDGLQLNLVRPGLMLYGVSPAPWLSSKVALKPVMSWKTGITHLKWIEPGTPVSYGATWVAKRRSLIATLPIGYADGYDRSYSNKADVLIRGHRAKIAGRVCMDMCMADVTDVPGVSLFDEVVLLGAQGKESLPVEELAAWSGTITYEILCGVGARVPRKAVADR